MHKLWKRVAVVAGILVMLGLGAFALKPKESQAPAHDHGETHYHAGFQMYVSGVLQDYTALEFMELQPCGPGQVGEDETVHLHNSVGDVVHVHHDGMTWQNLVDYLNGRIEESDEILGGTMVGYVDGEEVDDILAYPIQSYDSVVILVNDNGKNVDDKLKNAVTVDRIKQAEASKENCGS